MKESRRNFLRSMAGTAGAATALSLFPPVIQRALAIPANNRTGTIADIEHIVILMQENRAFDHYFGTMNGVRGFADPFPIPVADTAAIVGKNVWFQPNQSAYDIPVVAPFHINTQQNFAYMRVQGTPHTWADAQAAWDLGRMNAWPKYKNNHAMAYFDEGDLPFQYAMANAFTLCDAYHCSSQTGTNPNRIFHWTGTNDGLGQGNGPATYNDYDWFDADHGDGGYTWTTYPERLEAAGVSWQIYQNMADNYTDNPLAGFQSYRAAWYQTEGYSEALRAKAVTTRDLDLLRQDVLNNTLPQVSWIIGTAEGSEHPGPSSPAQGADYTAKVLEALTANPDVWSKTVFIVNFDENDGFFDHVPPPAPPAYADGTLTTLAGASTVDTTGEYNEVLLSYHDNDIERALLHRSMGLGPRVPMYILSPWTKGGWVNSQVFDHTSVLQFIEKRFGVTETNISAWRRAVAGDLTSAFNFANPDDTDLISQLPDTTELATRARALPGRTTPPTPTEPSLPEQQAGTRPSRALPYELHTSAVVAPAGEKITLSFANTGTQAAVFHVYDRLHLDAIPRRYTVGTGKTLEGEWALANDSGRYDLWVLGPNGYHRHFTGSVEDILGNSAPNPECQVCYDIANGDLLVKLHNTGNAACTLTLGANAYYEVSASRSVAAGATETIAFALKDSGYWYDFTVRATDLPGYTRRFAGRLETGSDSISDPAMHGSAVGTRLVVED